jgi:hypothetical protein
MWRSMKGYGPTVPDIRDLPEFREPLRAGRLPLAHAAAATAAIRRYNARIKALAAREARLTVLDLDWVTRVADRIDAECVRVAGRRIVRSHSSNDPDHLFLADVRHPGTVGQGLFAILLVATINAKFNARVPLLSEGEILEFAAPSQRPAPARAADHGRQSGDTRLEPGTVTFATVAHWSAGAITDGST